LSIIDDTKLT